ncbi:protein DMP3-like [Macadamia integrifolia]|uniref:protein DMP3-like n=1 Tax=Macadamia integrifolia TaxID=60698 RepID=UPI001C4F0F9D|nr:protein DMP3-like [Macadamia integrifolia]
MSLRTRSNRATTVAETPATEARVSSSSGSEKEPPSSPSSLRPRLQRTISQTLTGTAKLTNLLPTGTLMAFQLLIPIFTNNGFCDSLTSHLTLLLLMLLSLSCFLACFADSFKSLDGQVYYGIATSKGMWLFDYQPEATTGSNALPDLSKYKLRPVDFAHGVLTVLVFFSIALRDRNVLSCFYPQPKHEMQQLLDIVPVGVGLLCSLLFMVFPTRRHAIGYPNYPTGT